MSDGWMFPEGWRVEFTFSIMRLPGKGPRWESGPGNMVGEPCGLRSEDGKADRSCSVRAVRGPAFSWLPLLEDVCGHSSQGDPTPVPSVGHPYTAATTQKAQHGLRARTPKGS